MPVVFDYAEVQRWAAGQLAFGRTSVNGTTALTDDDAAVPRALRAAVRRFVDRLSQALDTPVLSSPVRVRYETNQLAAEDFGWHRDSVQSSNPEYADSKNLRQLIVYLSEPVNGTEWTRDDVGSPRTISDTCKRGGHSSQTCNYGMGSAFYFDQRLCHRRPPQTALPRLTMLLSLSLGPMRYDSESDQVIEENLDVATELWTVRTYIGSSTRERRITARS
jgi:hypothetical protein